MKQRKRPMQMQNGLNENNKMAMSLKHIKPMPRCNNLLCLEGIIESRENGELIRKLCKECEQIEREMDADTDVVVYYQNARAVGYEEIK